MARLVAWLFRYDTGAMRRLEAAYDSLPVTVAHRQEQAGPVVWLATAAGWLLAVAVMVRPGEGGAPWFAPFFVLLAIVSAAFGLRNLRRARAFTLDGDRIDVAEGTAFGTYRWTAPVADFKGLRRVRESVRRSNGFRIYYQRRVGLDLKRADPLRSIRLLQLSNSTGNRKKVEAAIDALTTSLKLPVLS